MYLRKLTGLLVLAFLFHELWAGVLIALSIALPISSFLALRDFKGKSFLSNLINTFMGFPPVVMGLIVYLMLSNSGPFGSLDLLYTPSAMIIAQLFLAIPIITGTTKAALESVNINLKENLRLDIIIFV